MNVSLIKMSIIALTDLKVIWTDVFQLFFMFLSTGYIIVVATQQAGGPAKVVKIMSTCSKTLSLLKVSRFPQSNLLEGGGQKRQRLKVAVVQPGPRST